MGILNSLNRLFAPAYRPLLTTNGKLIQQYTTCYKKCSVEKHTILYESRDGQSLTDSPLAIFEYLLETDSAKKYTHIWSIVKSPELEKIIAPYRHHDNVIFVERNSKEYLKWLASAEYLINNATFQPFFNAKKEQIYINTWHGTPLKTMGFDIPGSPSGAQNVVRNFCSTKYLISPNEHTTNMFLDSYRLRGMYQGEVLEGGYPRIDQTFKCSKEALLQQLKMFDLRLDTAKKILLYTPTWKGTNLSSARNDLAQIHAEMSYLKKVHGDTYSILVKVHPFLYKQAKRYEPLVPYLIPDVIDTNKLLGIVDVLITDYSSIFFDFLVTDKPIIFYCWDDDLYSEERGKYFEYEELPGPVAFTVKELSDYLTHLDTVGKETQENYERFKQRFVPYDDGRTTERYISYIFDKEQQHEITVVKNRSEKKRLLFYPGGMRNNGITSSFINLVKNIDKDKYEIICLMDSARSKEQIENIKKLPQSVHMLFRFGQPDFTMSEAYRDLYFHMFGMKKWNEHLFPANIYQREARRLLGNNDFDAAIDFSGYSLHWAKIILGAAADRRFCYMHSDMSADAQRVVNGKKIHKMNLTGLFSVYHLFDKVISVSKSTMEVNSSKLAHYLPQEKFDFSPNTVDIERIVGTETAAVSNREKTVESSASRFRGLLLADDVTVWNKRPDDSSARQMKLSLDKSKEVLGVGKVTIEECVYYKISQSDQYIGWIDSKAVKELPDEVIKKETVSLFGKIATTKESFLYSQPLSLPGTYLKSSAADLRNIYVEIKQIVTTTSDTSVLIVVDGIELGWLPLNEFRPSQRLNVSSTAGDVPFSVKCLRRLAVISSKLQKRSVYENLSKRTTLIKKVNKFATVDKTDALKLLAADNTKENMSDSVKTIYLADTYQESKSQKSYKLRDSFNQEFLIDAQYVHLIDEVTEESIFLQENQSYFVQAVRPQVKIYKQFSDIVNDNFVSISLSHDVQACSKIMTTLNREFIQIKIEDDHFWVSSNSVRPSTEKGVFNKEKEYIPFPATDEIKFVTMGRLSPEKNQQLIVEAFAEFYAVHKTGQLYIIGDGPEKKALALQIDSLGISDRIHLLGQVDNPFSFMKRCDIFVLTSHYEGQPMVLLESMTLGLKIISTDIPACRHVLEDGRYGLLTETNDLNGVLNAMVKVAIANESFESFNASDYNREATNRFYEVVS